MQSASYTIRLGVELLDAFPAKKSIDVETLLDQADQSAEYAPWSEKDEGREEMTETVECRGCGALLVDASPYDKERQPCSVCGPLRRGMSLNVVQELELYQQFKVKQKRPGAKRPVHEQVGGFDYTRSRGKFSKIVRVIDRENDQYYECITDPDTGEIIRECNEPLSHHFGRGSAKFQDHGLPEEEIAIAAYYIWKRAGEPHGWDRNHWFMAIEDQKRAHAGVPTIFS